MNTLWFGMRADEATEEDRIHHQLVPHEIKYESETDPVSWPFLIHNSRQWPKHNPALGRNLH